MRFYISTIADVDYIPDENGEYQIAYIHKTGPVAQKYGVGLELAEYCISENSENPETVLQFFKENLRYSTSYTFHAPFNELMPHAIDPAIARVAYDRYVSSYRMCEEYGIEKMVVHANFIASLYYEDWFIEKQVAFWKNFLENNPGKCQIVIENVMENYPRLITGIVKGVDDPRFRMCFDVGHANLHKEMSVYDWLEEVGPYISHLHIHNNDGSEYNIGKYGGSGDYHRSLGHGIIDYDRILKRAEELAGENLTATIESTEMEESMEWLIEHNFIQRRF